MERLTAKLIDTIGTRILKLRRRVNDLRSRAHTPLQLERLRWLEKRLDGLTFESRRLVREFDSQRLPK